MGKTIEEKEKEIIDAFLLLDGDIEMSNVYLIERGEKMPPLEDSMKTEDVLVKGCQSKVWLHASLNDGKVFYKADSNTVITKGLVGLLVNVLSDQTPKDIIESELTFIEKAGLHRFIGSQRSNGLLAMLKQMKVYALAYQMKMGNDG